LQAVKMLNFWRKREQSYLPATPFQKLYRQKIVFNKEKNR